MKLPAYDPAAICPKCGCSEIRSCYRRRATYGFDHGDFEYRVFCELQSQPFMKRVCQCCHYGWPEAPLDEKEHADADAG